MGANRQQLVFTSLNQTQLTGSQPVVVVQFLPSVTDIGRFGQPQHQVQIAQTSRAFFAIRFEAVWRVIKFGMTLAHFRHFFTPKGGHIKMTVESRVENLVDFFIARQVATFKN